MVLLSECDVGFTDMDVKGKTHARCVNGIFFDLILSSLWWDFSKPQVAPQSTRIDHYSRDGVSMTKTIASPTGDTPLYSYIDMTASHPTALSLSYTMHPPYVTGQVSRHPKINTPLPSWATSGACSAVTPPLPDV